MVCGRGVVVIDGHVVRIGIFFHFVIGRLVVSGSILACVDTVIHLVAERAHWDTTHNCNGCRMLLSRVCWHGFRCGRLQGSRGRGRRRRKRRRRRRRRRRTAQTGEDQILG